jgi:heat shock protein HslJ
MNYPKLLLACIGFTLAFQAAAQLKAGTIVRPKEITTSDSIEFYEMDIATRQKSYMNLLVGTWDFKIMKKQAKIDPDHLQGVTLTLNNDSTFTGQASCNKVWGKFSIKGTSIKFIDIASTKMTCNKQEEENWLLQLLQNTVSNYSVTKPKLLLRDGSSNIVFEANKKGE